MKTKLFLLMLLFGGFLGLKPAGGALKKPGQAKPKRAVNFADQGGGPVSETRYVPTTQSDRAPRSSDITELTGGEAYIPFISPEQAHHQLDQPRPGWARGGRRYPQNNWTREPGYKPGEKRGGDGGSFGTEPVQGKMRYQNATSVQKVVSPEKSRKIKEDANGRAIEQFVRAGNHPKDFKFSGQPDDLRQSDGLMKNELDEGMKEYQEAIALNKRLEEAKNKDFEDTFRKNPRQLETKISRLEEKIAREEPLSSYGHGKTRDELDKIVAKQEQNEENLKFLKQLKAKLSKEREIKKAEAFLNKPKSRASAAAKAVAPKPSWFERIFGN